MNLKNAYERYNLYLTLLCCGGLSIEQLAEELGAEDQESKELSALPIERIRMDLGEMILSRQLRNHVSADPGEDAMGAAVKNAEDFEDDWEYTTVWELLWKAAGIAPELLGLKGGEGATEVVHAAMECFRSGRFDSWYFRAIEGSQVYKSNTYYLLLSQEEYAALAEYEEAASPGKPILRTRRAVPVLDMYVKKQTARLSDEQVKNSRRLMELIEKKKGVEITYKQTRQVLYPHHLYRNAEDNFGYCIDVCGNAYRLDQMHLKKEIGGNDADRPGIDPEMDERLKCMWGIHMPEERPVELKLQVLNNTANIYSKFKADTENRAYGRFDEKTGIYTDRVLGLDGLRRWLRSYGSSVIVLEPLDLAKKMKDSARKMKQCYEAGDFVIK